MTKGRSTRVLGRFASLVVVFAGLRFAAPLIVPLVFAVFIATLSSPAVLFFVHRGMPRPFAVLAVLAIDLAALITVLSLIGSALTDLTVELPRYRERLEVVLENLSTHLKHSGLHVATGQLENALSPDSLMTVVGDLLTGAAELVGKFMIVLLTVGFLLLEATGLREKMKLVLAHSDQDLERFGAAATDVQKYLFVKTAMSLMTALAVTPLFYAFDVDFPLLWAVLTFLLNFIPQLGSALAGTPPIVLVLLMHGPTQALGLAAAYIAVNFTLGNIVEPRIMGRALGMSPLVVLISMFFWGWLWGPVGALLAVPLTMSAKIASSYISELSWISILLGPVPKLARREKSTVPPPAAAA